MVSSKWHSLWKLSKSRLWILKLIILMVTFYVAGCQTVPSRPRTMLHMEEEIEHGVIDDRVVEEKYCNLPCEVTEALVPNCLSTPDCRQLPVVAKRFDIIANQVPARTFFLGLVKDTPYNMSVPPSIVGKISLEMKKVTVMEVLETIRDVYGYDFKRTRSGFEILPATLQTRAFKINYLDLDREGKSEIRVSAGGLSSSTTGGVGGAAGVSTISNGGEVNEQIINSKILTTSKSDFWQELKYSVEALVGNGPGRKVAVSPMSGLIVVQAMPNELRKVGEFLRKAELTLNRQVILEAKILEVQLNDSYQAGINWSILTGRLRATQFGGQVAAGDPVVGSTFPQLTNNYTDDIIAISPGRVGDPPHRTILPPFDSGANVGSFGGVFTLAMNYKNLATFVELLGAQGKVQVLSSPRISTMNNQKALIKVGRDQFFITNISTTTTAIGTTASTSPNVTFDPFFSGIALDVTPSIKNCDEITLHIHPSVSDVKDEIKDFVLNGIPQSIPLAASTVRESDSMVRAKTGQMVVIGGLMQDNFVKIREGIPFFKDLPVVGEIFGHTIEKTKKSELVILLRPIIVTDDNVWTETMEDTMERFLKLDTGC